MVLSRPIGADGEPATVGHAVMPNQLERGIVPAPTNTPSVADHYPIQLLDDCSLREDDCSGLKVLLDNLRSLRTDLEKVVRI
jgi:hypothetical protein